MTMHELFIDDHKLVALELPTTNPQGTPIILLHGVTLSVGVWAVDETFRDFGPCYALSLPGHYPAVAPESFNEADLAPERLAYLLSRAIKALVGDKTVIVAGHSTGGFAALALAIYQPDLVQGVISLAGFAQGRWIGLYGLAQQIISFDKVWLNKGLDSIINFSVLHPDIYLQIWRGVAYNWQGLFSYSRMRTLMNYTYPNAQRLEWRVIQIYFRAMTKLNLTPLLEQIRVPLLAVAGGKDGVVPMTQAMLMARLVQHGELVIIPNVGHMLFVECPEQYDHILRDWLKRSIIL